MVVYRNLPTFTFGSDPIPNTVVGGLAVGIVQNAIANSIYSATVLHFQASHVDSANFNERGRPDWLGVDTGEQGTGVTYTPNPNNPLKGIFCPAPKRPIQGPEGIYYQADMELYLANYPGDVFRLFDNRPKLQDRFDIHNQRYYATSPAMPCALGDNLAAWKIALIIERSPVGEDRAWG